METLKNRLEQQNPPGNYYELLELACFIDDRDLILASVRGATRFLLQYQNHKNPEMVQRARSLQLLCATAVHTFSDADKWQTYDVELMTRFRDKFHSQTPVVDLKHWLLDACNVASHRLDEVADFVRSSPNQQSDATSSHSAEPSNRSEPAVLPPRPLPSQPAPVLNHGHPSGSKPVIGLAAAVPVATVMRGESAARTPPPLPKRGPLSSLPIRGQSGSTQTRSNLILWCVTGSILAITMIGVICLVVMNVRHHLHKRGSSDKRTQKVIVFDDSKYRGLPRNEERPRHTVGIMTGSRKSGSEFA